MLLLVVCRVRIGLIGILDWYSVYELKFGSIGLMRIDRCIDWFELSGES